MKDKNLKECVHQDCDLIMEAIRRLQEGTWRLLDDDQAYSMELFPKICMALDDHIRFEETFVFPDLGEADRLLHRQKHGDLLAQLRETEGALSNLRGKEFRVSLRKLTRLLHEHHQEFGTHRLNEDLTNPVGQCGPAGRICSRSDTTVL